MFGVARLGLQVFDGAVFVQSKFLLAIDFRPEEWYTVLAGLLALSIGSAALVGGVSTGGGILLFNLSKIRSLFAEKAIHGFPVPRQGGASMSHFCGRSDCPADIALKEALLARLLSNPFH